MKSNITSVARWFLQKEMQTWAWGTESRSVKGRGQKLGRADGDDQVWRRPIEVVQVVPKWLSLYDTPHSVPGCGLPPEGHSVRCGPSSAAETTLREVPGRLSANHTDVVEPNVFPSRGIWAIHVSDHQHQSKDSRAYTIWYHFYL